ncbi:hypothetical protein CYLTODRAFT_357063 [Cylindrobasidium torrendii FP15055 ss-10]|uniref:P-loop containing nucleoside triphosphate hydrolase protein n=1 Tax=Cylindrobasidium torrendii FP15055 ss-10 TaxID=1314674 RepID=A0A0D7B540_9AGAR|nr:hypothetical protein CYLTODRAFT_357063 [Cylindrobasidium torrendii FP15055 ss-10]
MHFDASGYASRSKELLGLITHLRAVGAQSELNLPRIVVIGNQSAGKSSVVESISGITVPREAGTCTRNPFECRIVSTSSTWKCRISIRREFNGDRRLNHITEEPFGNVLESKDQVEDMLRRAQHAVLSPQIDREKLLKWPLDALSGLAKTEGTAEFSRNVVCVDIEGPGLTDLSFIDLPGIVTNADNHVVKLVEDMVISHIEGNCIILVALPMTDDIENQKALKLARTVDPQGKRTIGVLTKPDLLSAGSIKTLSLWAEVIEGRRYPLSLGYYCTKQPDDLDRSEHKTASEILQAEERFFQSTAPWRHSARPERFGTGNLIAALSKLLVRIIDETLPSIRKDAADALSTCRKALSTIPPKSSEEPTMLMLRLVTEFGSDITSIVKGRSDASALIQGNLETFKEYKIAVRSTAPAFVPRLDGDKAVKEPGFDWSFNKDDEESSGPPAPVLQPPFDLLDMREHIKASITRELPNNVPFEAKTVLILRLQNTWKTLTDECFQKVQDRTIQLLYAKVDEVFGQYSLLVGHIKTFLADWLEERANLTNIILDAILVSEHTPFTQNTHYLEASTEKWLLKYRDFKLGKKVEKKGPNPPTPVASNDVRSLFGAPSTPARPPTESVSTTPQTARPTMRLPGRAATSAFHVPPAPSTTGPPPELPTGRDSGDAAEIIQSVSANPAFSRYSHEVLDPQAARTRTQFASAQSTPLKTVDELAVNEALAALARLGFKGLTPESLGKLQPTDEYETELRVMAEVRGYFQVAYKRIIDIIPQLIDSNYLQQVAQKLQPFLASKFIGSGKADECEMYLQQDPGIVARRDKLQAREKRLLEVQSRLMAFGMGV